MVVKDASGVQIWLEIMNGTMKRNDVGTRYPGWKYPVVATIVK